MFDLTTGRYLETAESVSTVEEVPILLFKPIASAKETAARGRRLRLRTVLQAAGAIKGLGK